jgi:hypothetical protein
LTPGKPVSAIFRSANTFTESAVEVEPLLTDLGYAYTSTFFCTPEKTLGAFDLLNAHTFA